MADGNAKWLSQFTQTFYNRLPLELRRAVYHEMLDKKTIKHISKCVQATTNITDCSGRERVAKTTLDYYPYHLNGKQNPKAIAFIDPKKVYGQVAAEVVTAFFERYQGYEVKETSAIAEYLQADMFGVGVSLSTIALPIIEVSIYPGTADPNRLEKDFEPLLSKEQKWASGFQLHIDLIGPNRGPAENKMWAVVKKVKAIRVKARKKGAEVFVDYVSETEDYTIPLTSFIKCAEEPFLATFYNLIYEEEDGAFEEGEYGDGWF